MGPLCSYAMSESVSSLEIKSARSFASLLESFTGPPKQTDQMWDDSSLCDDIATISYEQALRSNRRVPPVNTPHDEAQSPTTPGNSQPATLKKRKSASITVRLSEAEQIQLHERAAAAQLSVSAYLRSCIFEAESLRTQVKEALSQIRSAEADPSPQPEPKFSWRSRLLPRWRQRYSA
jgi:hypothetical protein